MLTTRETLHLMASDVGNLIEAAERAARRLIWRIKAAWWAFRYTTGAPAIGIQFWRDVFPGDEDGALIADMGHPTIHAAMLNYGERVGWADNHRRRGSLGCRDPELIIVVGRVDKIAYGR